MEILFAQATTTQPGILGFLPLVLMAAIFYFIVLRPQSKQKKEHATMLSSLKKGDRILTRGGIYGNIIDFQGKDIIILDTGTGHKLNISRSYIAGLEKSSKNEDK